MREELEKLRRRQSLDGEFHECWRECVCVCTREGGVCKKENVCVSVCVCVCVYVYACVCMCMRVCQCVCMHVCQCVCLYLIYSWYRVCVYVCIMCVCTRDSVERFILSLCRLISICAE